METVADRTISARALTPSLTLYLDCLFACLADANGNITQITAENGDVLAQYEYGPFGNITASSGAKKDDFSFRFSTKYWDEETGRYYYGYREYEPDWGRWLSRDPIAERGGINLYGFVANQPVVMVDPYGRQLLITPMIGPILPSLLPSLFNTTVCKVKWKVDPLEFLSFARGDIKLKRAHITASVEPATISLSGFNIVQRASRFIVFELGGGQIQYSYRDQFDGNASADVGLWDISTGTHGPSVQWTATAAPLPGNEMLEYKIVLIDFLLPIPIRDPKAVRWGMHVRFIPGTSNIRVLTTTGPEEVNLFDVLPDWYKGHGPAMFYWPALP